MGQNQPRSVSTRHSSGRCTFVGPATLWSVGSDVPEELRAGSQGENDSGPLPGPFFGLHFVSGMAPLLLDLNPMDYSMWSILEAKVCANTYKRLESLKQLLRREGDQLSPEELRPNAENFKSRLDRCITIRVGHFEIG